jgi:hypothetical protein
MALATSPVLEMVMKNTILVIMLFVLLVPARSYSGVNTVGVDYLAETNSFVYGGSALYARSRIQEDIQRLYTQRLGSNVRDLFYQAEWPLTDIQTAPRNRLVGVVEHVWEENIDRERATFVDRRLLENDEVAETFSFEDARLLILSFDGVLRGSISGVRRYAWDPDGRRIAYVSGTYAEGAGFSTTGTWIYDIETAEAMRIHSGGVDVQWANWDGNIYIYDPANADDPEINVLRFETSTKQLVATPHQGIYFAPDGKRYYRQGSEGSALAVFETETDTRVAAQLLIQFGDRSHDAMSARSWVDEDTLIVPSPFPGDGDYLFNIDTGTMRHATGAVIPIRGDDDRALVVEGTYIVERTVNEFALVP